MSTSTCTNETTSCQEVPEDERALHLGNILNISEKIAFKQSFTDWYSDLQLDPVENGHSEISTPKMKAEKRVTLSEVELEHFKTICSNLAQKNDKLADAEKEIIRLKEKLCIRDESITNRSKDTQKLHEKLYLALKEKKTFGVAFADVVKEVQFSDGLLPFSVHTENVPMKEHEISYLKEICKVLSEKNKSVIDLKDELNSIKDKVTALESESANNLPVLHSKEIISLNKKIKLRTNKSNYKSVYELLSTAEKHDGFATGRYLEKVVSCVLRNQFKNIQDSYVDIVFPSLEKVTSFLEKTKHRLFQTKKIQCCDYMNREYTEFVFYDVIGDIAAEVRVYVSENYGWEAYNNLARFIPSWNIITVTGLSISRYYKDCDAKVFRFTGPGATEVLSGNGRYAKFDVNLSVLATNYTLITLFGVIKVHEKQPVLTPGMGGNRIGRYFITYNF